MPWGIEKQDLEVGCLDRRVAAQQAEGLAVVIRAAGTGRAERYTTLVIG